MRIGDKVRFLNDVGGGKVAGFQGKNIVLVEDEDGFQVPALITDVVVEQSNDYSMGRALKRDKQGNSTAAEDEFVNPGNRSVSAMLRDGQDEEIDMTVEDTVDDSLEVTFRQPARERVGGDELSAYLAFVPDGDPNSGDPAFDVVFVNDCNYAMHYVYATADGDLWNVQADGEVEPNTQVAIGRLHREDIQMLSRVNVQLATYKRDRAYRLKPAVDVTLRIDPVRFFRANAFRANAYFDKPALIYTLVENDRVEQSRAIDADQLRAAMYKDTATVAPASAAATHEQRAELVRRYSSDQRKGGRHGSPFIRERSLDDALVVDLHADQLLDTTQGMTPGEILEYQLKVMRETLDSYAGHRGQKIVFIHGKGEGVLRRAVIHELNYRYKSYVYQDASFQEYGYGATMVEIK